MTAIPENANKVVDSVGQELLGEGTAESRLSGASAATGFFPSTSIINKGIGKYGPDPKTIISTAKDVNEGSYINALSNLLPEGVNKYLDLAKNTGDLLDKQGLFNKKPKIIKSPGFKTGGKKYKRKRRPIIKGYRNRLQQ